MTTKIQSFDGAKKAGTRRGNHEGGIRIEPNGHFRMSVTMTGGKRISKTFRTKDEGRNWIREMYNQADLGLKSKTLFNTVQSYTETWLDNVKTNKKEKTFLQYNDILSRFILPKFGAKLLRDLDPVELEKFINSLKKERTGARTLQLVYVIFHSLLHSALRQRVITYNPLDAVQKPAYDTKKRKRLTLEQRIKLIETAQGDSLEALYLLAITYGLREGELLGLRWCDVDLEEKVLVIRQQVQRLPGKGLVFRSPKTKHSERPIYLGDIICHKLMDHHQKALLLRKFAGESWCDHDLVFPNHIGNPIEPRNLLRKFKELIARVDLPGNTTIHDLRHAAITTLNNDIKAPISVAQMVAGHTRASTTLNIYTGDPDEEMMRYYSTKSENLLMGINVAK